MIKKGNLSLSLGSLKFNQCHIMDLLDAGVYLWGQLSLLLSVSYKGGLIWGLDYRELTFGIQKSFKKIWKMFKKIVHD